MFCINCYSTQNLGHILFETYFVFISTESIQSSVMQVIIIFKYEFMEFNKNLLRCENVKRYNILNSDKKLIIIYTIIITILRIL